MIFLYRFEYSTLDGMLSKSSVDPTLSQAWFYTNYERAITLEEVDQTGLALPWEPKTYAKATALSENPRAFQPLPGLSHSGIRLDGQKTSGQASVTLPADCPVAQLFALEYPGGDLWLTIYSLEPTAVDNTSQPDYLTVWAGRVTTGEFQPPLCTLKCNHISDILRRPGLTDRYSRTCSAALYDRATCRVIRDAVESASPTCYFKFREDGAIAAEIDPYTLQIAEATNRAAGFFDHGFIVIEPDYAGARFFPRATAAGNYSPLAAEAMSAGFRGGIRRAILSHTGNTIVLATPLLTTVPSGARITLYAGCNKSREACTSKFQNVVFFRGYDRIPLKNPYETGLM